MTVHQAELTVEEHPWVTREELDRRDRFAITLAVLFAIGLMLVSYAAWHNWRGVSDTVAENRAGQCGFKHYLYDQVVAQLEYLADVRSGERKRIEGITDADIQRSINDRTRAFLSITVTCDWELDAPPLQGLGG